MSDKDIILKAENISKQYRLGVIGTGTISHDLNRWWQKVRGNEDPFLKIGESNDRATKGESDYVWALKDINFEVKRGEVLGIIGKNGAGKSTLLKILSRVTGPTTGLIKSAGRIASLLEVGTGFHPELTGKENIFLNGAILGMTKAEIKDKLDEIVEFSGCERYVDTPVKRYSSGMRVRLAFAVAAFLEPDILVVDEVLAVGDAEFQKKAIGKMKDISKGDGRTVLFVSHNMASIQNLCSNCIVLNNGTIGAIGETSKMIEYYLKSNLEENKIEFSRREIKLNEKAILIGIRLLSKNGLFVNSILSGQSFNLELKINSNVKFEDINIEIGLDNDRGERLTFLSSEIVDNTLSLEKGLNEINVIINKFPFLPGNYNLTIRIRSKELVLDWLKECYSFDVEAGDFYKTGKINSKSKGKFLIDYEFQKK